MANNKNNIPLNFELNQNQLIPNRLYTFAALYYSNADENKIALSLLLHSNDQIFEDKNNHLKIAKISIDELDAHDQIINSTTHDYDLTLEKENNQ